MRIRVIKIFENHYAVQRLIDDWETIGNTCFTQEEAFDLLRNVMSRPQLDHGHNLDNGQELICEGEI